MHTCPELDGLFSMIMFTTLYQQQQGDMEWYSEMNQNISLLELCRPVSSLRGREELYRTLS